MLGRAWLVFGSFSFGCTRRWGVMTTGIAFTLCEGRGASRQLRTSSKTASIFFGQLIHAQFHHRKALACCQRRIWHNCHATLSLFPWTRSQRRHRHHGLQSEARCKKGGDLNIEAADHSMRVCSKPCLKVSFTP